MDSTSTSAVKVEASAGRHERLVNSSPYVNARLALSEFEAGQVVVESLPPIVHFALTSFCNNRKPCLICDRHVRPVSADTETTAEVVECVQPLLRTALCVFLHCGGEPMFTRHFDTVIDSLEPPTRASFATNARLLTRARADRMLARDVIGNFVVSLDASTPETHHLMRPSSRFEQVVDAVAYYATRSRALGRKSGPVLNMTICQANLEDVPGLVDLARATGAVGVQYGHLNDGLTHSVTTCEGWDWHYVEQAGFRDVERHDELVMEAYCRAREHGLHMSFVGRPFLGSRRHTVDRAVLTAIDPAGAPWPDSAFDGWRTARVRSCPKPWREVFIQPRGDLRECCYHEPGRWTLGNLGRQHFWEVWNSAEMIAERRHFLEAGYSPRCAASAPCSCRGRI